MSRIVRAVPGAKDVRLPDGWVLDGGDQVTISDQTWAQILLGEEALVLLEDLGPTAASPDPVPSWRDIQRLVSASPVGLQAQIDDLEGDLITHVGSTINVHGIPDTSVLATDEETLEYEQVFTFATPSNHWQISHGQNTKSLNVECFLSDGSPLWGEVTFDDGNTISAHWYYPTSGYARVFS